MVILGLEKPVEYGSRQIFDPTMANMVLNAQNRYIQAMREDYLQGREDLKEFNKNFGDFFSPIQKDMEWYDQNVTGATRDLINNLYAQGMDMRNPEFRAAVSRFINTMPVGKINQLKQSAATANKYLENMGKLMAEGRYNPDAEKFFGRDLSSWDTLGGSGIWNSSSPIENMTMDEIIEPIIKNLDYTYDEARTKQANDGNDYYTVTEDRIRQTIADAMEDLTRNGTMPGYYYNKALQAVGGDKDKAIALYTDWLTNRGKDHLKEKFEPNQYEMMRRKNAYDRSNILLQDRLARDRDAVSFQYKMALQQAKNNNSKYGSLKGIPYSLTEEVHHDGLYTAIINRGIPVPKLIEDEKGNLVPAAKGTDGKYVAAKDRKQWVYINPSDATWEELEYAANDKNALIQKQLDFAKKQSGTSPYSFIFDKNVHKNYLNTYGFHLNSLEVQSMLPTKKMSKGGAFILSTQDLKNMRALSGVIAQSAGSRVNEKYKGYDGLKDVLPQNEDAYDFIIDKINSNKQVEVDFRFDDTSDKNVIQLVGKDGETQIWVKGDATFITSDTKMSGHSVQTHTSSGIWLPTNIKSNKALRNKSNTKYVRSNFGTNSKNRSAYEAIDAHYAKITGSQKNTNIALDADIIDQD